MKLNEIGILFDDILVKEFLYSINDELFYYNVINKNNDESVYEFNKEEHDKIQYLKECYLIRKV